MRTMFHEAEVNGRHFSRSIKLIGLAITLAVAVGIGEAARGETDPTTGSASGAEAHEDLHLRRGPHRADCQSEKRTQGRSIHRHRTHPQIEFLRWAPGIPRLGRRPPSTKRRPDLLCDRWIRDARDRGKLVNEKRTNPTNLTGTAIEGGTPRNIAKGDFILVPENTPHWFSPINGVLVLFSVHAPRP